MTAITVTQSSSRRERGAWEIAPPDVEVLAVPVHLPARSAARRKIALPLPILFIVPVLVVAALLLWFTGAVRAWDDTPAPIAAPPVQPPASGASSALAADGALSPIFTPEVRYWENDIRAWGASYGFDPNLVATVIQIESCGNPSAVSGSGAQGLFQVMPFHFSAGENMQDPQTNATRGLNFLTEMLKQANGHVGLALVGYNGGYRAVQGSWETWAPETRRYYRWGAGIYMDAITGLTDSPTLHDWLSAGGDSLCGQAHAQLQMP